MDAHGGRPARNFYVSLMTVVITVFILLSVPFVIGAWYAPFHSVQEIIPENLMLKRQNEELRRSVADANTLNHVKDEQLDSLKEQIEKQERVNLDLTKELHMLNSILDQRKGKGIQILENKANWLVGNAIEWQVLFVKGGSFPRFLTGTYKVFVIDAAGERFNLSEKKMKYRFESHDLIKQKFEWREEWLPVQLELVVYDSRGKEALKEMITIEGK